MNLTVMKDMLKEFFILKYLTIVSTCEFDVYQGEHNVESIELNAHFLAFNFCD